MVYDALISDIDRDFPQDTPSNILDIQLAEHEIFEKSFTQCYIPVEGYLNQIDLYLVIGGDPLVVVGTEGMGKSALLAYWVSKYQTSKGNKPVIYHSLEAHPQAAQIHLMLLRLISEIIRWCKLDDELPVTRDILEIQNTFINILNSASEKGGAILVIDGLNRLEVLKGKHHLKWLPVSMPINIRFIVSTSPGDLENELINRGWQTLILSQLGLQDRKNLIQQYLSQYSKVLTRVQIEKIINVDLSGNPLFLKSLLSELRIFGEYERLNNIIDHFLSSKSIIELFDRICDRWENDYNYGNQNIVGKVLELIWASRRGLSEIEIVQALGSASGPFPRAYLSPLLLAAEYILSYRSCIFHGSKNPLLWISKESFHDAVQRRYLQTKSLQQLAHIHLSDFFLSNSNTYRQLDELPWQYSVARDWKRLFDLLSDLPFIRSSWSFDSADIINYWTQIINNSTLRLDEAYREVLNSPQKFDIESVKVVASIFMAIGPFEYAVKLHVYLVDYYRTEKDQNELISNLGKCGVALWRTGRHQDAVAFYREQEMLCREIGDKKNLANCLGNLGNVLHLMGNLRDAMSLHIEEEQLCLELQDHVGLLACLSNQAIIMYDLGDSVSVLKLAKRQESMGLKLGIEDAVAKALGHQARVLFDIKDATTAMELRKKEEEIYRRSGDPIGLSSSIGNQALIKSSLCDIESALSLHREEESICRKVGYKHGLQFSLGNQAILMARQGKIAETELLFKEQENLCREMDDISSLIYCLFNQAVFLIHNTNRPNQALNLAEQAYKLAEHNGFINLVQRINSILELIHSRL